MDSGDMGAGDGGLGGDSGPSYWYPPYPFPTDDSQPVASADPPPPVDPPPPPPPANPPPGVDGGPDHPGGVGIDINIPATLVVDADVGLPAIPRIDLEVDANNGSLLDIDASVTGPGEHSGLSSLLSLSVDGQGGEGHAGGLGLAHVVIGGDSAAGGSGNALVTADGHGLLDGVGLLSTSDGDNDGGHFGLSSLLNLSVGGEGGEGHAGGLGLAHVVLGGDGKAGGDGGSGNALVTVDLGHGLLDGVGLLSTSDGATCDDGFLGLLSVDGGANADGLGIDADVLGNDAFVTAAVDIDTHLATEGGATHGMGLLPMLDGHLDVA